MTEPLPDRRVIACNYAVPGRASSQGSLAYVQYLNLHNDGERVQILSRSRSGRWISRWERIDRLCNFRCKTLPPEHPHYQMAGAWYDADTAEQSIVRIRHAAEYWRAQRQRVE